MTSVSGWDHSPSERVGAHSQTGPSSLTPKPCSHLGPLPARLSGQPCRADGLPLQRA